MTECDECAAGMLARYLAWLAGDKSTKARAVDFVSDLMGDESFTIVDNIAHSLHQLAS
jgi:hypothetical protein